LAQISYFYTLASFYPDARSRKIELSWIHFFSILPIAFHAIERSKLAAKALLAVGPVDDGVVLGNMPDQLHVTSSIELLEQFSRSCAEGISARTLIQYFRKLPVSLVIQIIKRCAT